MQGPNICQLLLVSTFLLLCHNPLLAEGATNGKEFYVAFLGNADLEATFYLYVATSEREPVSFTINAPGTGYSANGMVEYGEVATFAFESSVYELGTTTDRGKAIIVRAESDKQLTVYGGSLRYRSSDSFLSLPKQPDHGQSTYKYIVASYITTLFSDIDTESSVAILAQYSDTLLSVTPTLDTMIGTTFTPAGTTTDVILQEAETLLVANTNDLTGLTVVSNKPLAVLSGHKCTNIPSSVRFCDHLVEQIPPVPSWGRQFATAPLEGREAYDVFRVVASEDSTVVVVNCTSSDPASTTSTNTYQLGEGSFAEFNVPSDQYCFIQGSANILVLQYSVGETVDGITGDPAMIIVPAITQYCNQYSLPTIQPSDGSINFTHYMNILIPAPFYQLDQVFLDNLPLNSYSLNFTAIEQDGDPQVYAAQVDLTEGVHTLYHTGPEATLGVVMYGFTTANSYGHPGGLQLTQAEPPRPNRITLTPPFGSIYGGTPVTVTLSEQVLLTNSSGDVIVDILCTFDQVESPGMAITTNVALCVTPARANVGFVSFQVRVALGDEELFTGSSSFVAISGQRSHEVDVTKAASDDRQLLILAGGEDDGTPTRVSVEWPVDFVDFMEPEDYTVDLHLHELDLTTFSLSDPLNPFLLKDNIVNTGRYEDDIDTSMFALSSDSSTHMVVFHVSVNLSALSSGVPRIGKWSGAFVYFTEASADLDAECSVWYGNEPDDIGSVLLGTTVPCPSTQAQADLPNSGLLEVDVSSFLVSTSYHIQHLQFYHPGAATCYEQIARTTGPSQECCYDSAGRLLINSPGGGSVDRFGASTVDSQSDHIMFDLFPYIHCCKGMLRRCTDYYEVRPSEAGRNFFPPIPGCWYGDPHIVTLDGHKYTFNGKGDYILLDTDDNSFTLHGRMEEARMVNSSTVSKGTVFTALVARQSDSDTVQFELGEELLLRINGVVDTFTDLDEMTFTNVVVQRKGNSSFSAAFSSGVYIEVRAVTQSDLSPYFSVVIVSMPASYQGLTRGLMGNYNGDTADDIVPRSGGDPLPLNSTLSTLHWSFGVTWVISNASQSLFTYDGVTFEELSDPGFTPLFEPVFTDSVLEVVANEMCGGDVFCLFDIAVTEDIDIGLETLMGGLEFDMIMNASQPFTCTPPCVNGACVDGNVCACSAGYDGDRCDQPVITACASSPCQNGGTCTQLAGTYTCTCRNGYTGNVCQSVPPEVSPSDGVTSKPIGTGDPVTISFTIVNQPVPPVTREAIQWVFAGSSGPVNIYCTSNSKYTFSDDCLNLTVNNTEGSDAGLYQIAVTTEAGIGMSAVGIAVSGVHPEVVTPLVSATLPQGGSYLLTCAAVADPRPLFVFRFNGERITSNSSKYTVVTNNTHGTLTVFNLRGSDKGTYNCSASNRYGSVSSAAVLTVQVPPTLTFSPSAVRDVVKRESLVASCRGSADPPPVILWFREDQLLGFEDQSPGRVAISNTSNDVSTTSQLTVTGFTSEDVRVYSCMAFNDLGSDSNFFLANAVMRPNITNITRTVNGSEGPTLFHEGLLSLVEFTPQLELTCEAYGAPPPIVAWLKDGVVLQNLTSRRIITVEGGVSLDEPEGVTRSTLSLSEVQLSDAGEYTCRASSGNVSPIPGTTAWKLLFIVTELNECDPKPCLNNGTCVDGVQNYTCNCASFTVNEVEIYYTGRNCGTVVDNRAAPSIVTNSSNMTVILHDGVRLSCIATGNPTPSIQWYKDSKPIEGPQAIGNVFIIPEITPDERGFYQCEAFSSFGSPSRSAVAVVLIQGIVQFRIKIVFVEEGEPGGRRKRQASANIDIVETLQLQIVNQPLPVEGNYTATVYSVESAMDDSSQIVITVTTDSSESAATLTEQLTRPLEQVLEEVGDIDEQISFVNVTTERHDGCPEQPVSTCGNVGPVTWPESEIGEVAFVPCPCGVSDSLIQNLGGTRRCGGTYETGAVWEEPQCDSCQFSDTRLTLCRLAQIDSPAQLANELVNVTENSEEIKKEDVSLTVELMSTVTNSMEDLQEENVQMDVLTVVSNVQQVPPDELISSQEQSNSSNRILDFVEDVLNVVKVAPKIPFEFAAPLFGVRVEDPPEDLGEEESFTPNITALLNQVMSSTAGVMQMEEIPELPPAMVTLASTLLNPDDTGSRPSVSASIFASDALFQQRINREKEKIGSIVVDLSLRLNGKVMNVLRPPNTNVVKPSFTKSMLARNERSNATCRFWNFTADVGFGAWDGHNCRILNETAKEVQCGCDHLTHFAILLDINHDPPSSPTPVEDALTGVSYIGTVLSIISLTITIVTHLGEPEMRKTVHSKLLINLCFALVGLYVTFITSTFSTSVPVLCGLVSALMHYFFLAVFFWMAAEAIHLHRKLVTVFKPDIKSYLSITMAICWVVPAFIVVFSLAPHYQNYIHPQYCRVHDYSFWIGLLIPFGIMYIMNWVVFILIFASLLCRPNVRKETSNSGNLRKLKENFMIALGLSTLFGMGWAIGLLASSDLPPAVRYPAEWVFTLMTAFLGVYLFMLYVVRSQEARRLWKRWLLCQRKRKRGVSVSSSQAGNKSRLNTFSSTLTSWKGTLRRGRSTVKNGDRLRARELKPVNLELVKRMKPDEWYYSDAFSPDSSIIPPEVAIEGAEEATSDRRPGQNRNADDVSLSVAEELTATTDVVDWHYNKVYSLGSTAASPQSHPTPTGTDEECYIVENKQAKEAVSDVTPL